MITSALSRERELGDCFPEIPEGYTDRGGGGEGFHHPCCQYHLCSGAGYRVDKEQEWRGPGKISLGSAAG